MSSNSRIKAFFKMSPAKYILLSFALLIFIGAFLLCLPISNVNGEWRSFIDALFSSTTSVCVTGLMTIDIATEFTLFGEFIVLLLIQMGGLGFVTCASLLYMMIGKKINYQTRMTLQESLNADDNAGVIKMVRHIFLITAICEFAGFLMLLPSMIKFSGNFWSGTFKALFLAISAFCNAGIDPLGPVTADFSNIASFATNASVLIPLMILIVLGGLGFITYAIFFLVMIGGKVGIGDRMLIKEVLNLDSGKGIIKNLLTIVLITICCQIVGAIATFLIIKGSYPTLDAIGISIFHAISAFNNVGFDIFGYDNSLINFAGNIPLNIVTMLLIIVGGFGFITMQELIKKRKWKDFYV